MHFEKTINWSAIDTVLLDMDGTLLDLHFDSFFWLDHLPKRYSQIHHCEISVARQYLLKELSANRGTIEWYCVDHWSEKLKVDIKSLRSEVTHNICYRPFVEDFLTLLNKLEVKVVLVTNDHRSGLEMKLSLTGLERYLDAIVVSHDFNVAKEEQRFWHQMQAVEPFNPKSTLFIDDTVAVLESAKLYGIEHLRCVDQPSSQSERSVTNKFVGIDCFSSVNDDLVKYINS